MSNDITEVNSLRNFIREIYLESFQSADEHHAITKKRTIGEAKSRIHAFFEENFIVKNSENEDILKFDSRSVNQNPLFDIWKMCHFKKEYLTRDFAIFDLLSKEEYKDGITEYDLKNDISGKGELQKYTKKEIGHKQLKPYIENLKDCGILTAKDKVNDEGKLLKSSLTLSPTKNLQNIVKNSPSILSAIRFASEIFPCGVIGSYILDSVNQSDFISPIFFKHHFISNTLDSEIIYTVLSAIREDRFITCSIIKNICDEEKNITINIIPVQVRFSARDGRSYLIYYGLEQPLFGFNSENFENIISAKPGDIYLRKKEIISDYSVFEKAIWGKSIPQNNKNQTENVNFTIKYEDNELYILKRLKRETFKGDVYFNPSQNTASFSLNLLDSQELIPWIRSFFGRIIDFKFDRTELQEQLKKEITDLVAIYENIPSSSENPISTGSNHIQFNSDKKRIIFDSETNFFHRYYSAYYQIALKTIKSINAGKITTEKEFFEFLSSFKILNGKTVYKTEGKQLDFLNAVNDIIFLDQETKKVSTSLKKIPADFMVPLTSLEISFLKTIIQDERCALLLGDSITLLQDELDKPQYSNIHPFFEKNYYKVFDQYINGDSFLLKDDSFVSYFNLIMDACKEKKTLKFEYVEDGISKTKVAIPEKLEYSLKEDRFKVIINCKTRPLDIQNITSCILSNEKESLIKEKEILNCVVIINTDKQFIRDRFFREFSPFERDCKKIDANGHILSFKFEKGDYKEVAVRLLQFGPYVYCAEPECVKERIKEKITMQNVLLQKEQRSRLKL